MKCDRSLFKDFIYDIFDCCNIKNDDRVFSYFDKGLRRRDVVDVPCYMNVLAK